MTRFALTLAALGLTASLGLAGVAPVVPRLPAAALKGLKADGQAGDEDPVKLAERIKENTKAASDRLADQDTGEETRKRQEQALKDLDKLLKQNQNPPPMSGQSNQNNQDQDNMGGGQQQPMGGGQSQGGGQQPKGGGGQGGKQPMGGGQGQRGSWRDRNKDQSGQQQPMGGGQPKKENAGQQPMGGSPMPMPMGGNQPMPSGGTDPKNPAGARGGGARTTPSLPLDEVITKKTWGHLPERLRQQMSQYYREQFMPRYGELLRQYYASLAEREKAQNQKK